jgi:hypothetical protein
VWVSGPAGAPKRERSVYESASVVFGAIIVGFGLWGAIDSLAAGEGVGSAAFLISATFVLLGGGRVYLGLR